MAKNDLKRARDEGEEGDTKLSRTGANADVAAAKTKRKSSAVEPPRGTDVDGNTFWELSKMRRVGISHFKNSTLVNIREYYESAGQMRPGKKGISLSLDQYKSLVRAIPHITAALKDDGVDVADLEEDAGNADESPSAAPAATGAAAKKKTKKVEKANIEATSDEDSS